VPVDGSELAEIVLPHVVSFAKRFGSTIELVRAYTPPASLIAASAASAMPGTGPVLDPGPFIAAGRKEASVYLASVAEHLRKHGINVVESRLEGPAGEAIVGEARQKRADLIAMTTHGRGGLGRLVLGSVADYVLRHAPCPVLLVRADRGHSS
jgi:nucleotide-binding universal stress UspA family protein